MRLPTLPGFSHPSTPAEKTAPVSSARFTLPVVWPTVTVTRWVAEVSVRVVFYSVDFAHGSGANGSRW